MAEEQHGGRSQRREPERLDVERTWIVTQRVEQRVRPRLDGERGGHRFLPATTATTATGEVKVSQSVKTCLYRVNGRRPAGTPRGSGGRPRPVGPRLR